MILSEEELQLLDGQCNCEDCRTRAEAAPPGSQRAAASAWKPQHAGGAARQEQAASSSSFSPLSASAPPACTFLPPPGLPPQADSAAEATRLQHAGAFEHERYCDLSAFAAEEQGDERGSVAGHLGSAEMSLELQDWETAQSKTRCADLRARDPLFFGLTACCLNSASRATLSIALVTQPHSNCNGGGCSQREPLPALSAGWCLTFWRPYATVM